MSTDMAFDYDTDMQTIRDYVSLVTEVRQRVALVYVAALDQVQLVFQSAAPSETRPDIVGVALKAGFKVLEKTVVSELQSATGADLGPLVDLAHGIYDEVERAAKAAQNLAAATWIMQVRSAVTNVYAQSQTGDELRVQIEGQYRQQSEGGRGGYIAGVELELEALRSLRKTDASGADVLTIPSSGQVEIAMYESWINQNFNGDCMDGTGIVRIQFDGDGTPGKASVDAPLGEKIAARLDQLMLGCRVTRLMDLNVVKQVCRDDECMCFESDNTIRKDVLSEDTHAFLTSASNWSRVTRFGE